MKILRQFPHGLSPGVCGLRAIVFPCLLLATVSCSSTKKVNPTVWHEDSKNNESAYVSASSTLQSASSQIEKHEILSNLHRDAAQCLKEGKSTIECNRKLKDSCNYAGLTTGSCEAGL